MAVVLKLNMKTHVSVNQSRRAIVFNKSTHSVG